MLGVDVCEFGGQVLELLWLTVCYRGLLSDKKDLQLEEGDEDRHLNYNPPAQKSVQEIQEMDKEDESLVRYKQTLLGQQDLVADSSGPNVQVTRMTLLCDDAGENTMDLTDGQPCRHQSDPEMDFPFSADHIRLHYQSDLSEETTFVLKEGATFRIKLHFKVNREIVAGLRYHHVSSRKGINVDKASYMVGSYGPLAEEQEFLGPPDEAPKGMISRGSYQFKSKLIDDDKNVHLTWTWNIDVKKDWE